MLIIQQPDLLLLISNFGQQPAVLVIGLEQLLLIVGDLGALGLFDKLYLHLKLIPKRFKLIEQVINLPLLLFYFDHGPLELPMEEHHAVLVVCILVLFLIDKLNVLEELFGLLLELQLLLLLVRLNPSFQLLYLLFQLILLLHVLSLILLPLNLNPLQL